jgi:RNA polymerase sigma-70 factor (ECF subfamily)
MAAMFDSDLTWQSTLALLTRARAGDQEALNDLFARYVPVLQRWARGRLPVAARDLADTSDLVQDTLIQVFKRLEAFDHRGEGALLAYLRQAVMNRIRNELRNARRRPELAGIEVAESKSSDEVSPLEAAIGSEDIERYEAALNRLRDTDRELVIARVELGMTYAEIAEAVDRASPDAARMAVARALVQLVEELRRDNHEPSRSGSSSR